MKSIVLVIKQVSFQFYWVYSERAIWKNWQMPRNMQTIKFNFLFIKRNSSQKYWRSHLCKCVSNSCFFRFKKTCSWNHGIIIDETCYYSMIKLSKIQSCWCIFNCALKKAGFFNIWDKWKYIYLCFYFIICSMYLRTVFLW